MDHMHPQQVPALPSLMIHSPKEPPLVHGAQFKHCSVHVGYVLGST
jgi:hypothetical protein